MLLLLHCNELHSYLAVATSSTVHCQAHELRSDPACRPASEVALVRHRATWLSCCRSVGLYAVSLTSHPTVWLRALGAPASVRIHIGTNTNAVSSQGYAQTTPTRTRATAVVAGARGAGGTPGAGMCARVQPVTGMTASCARYLGVLDARRYDMALVNAA